MVTLEQHKWVAKLLGYDYEILYKTRKQSLAAYALSRVPGSPTLNALFVLQARIWDEIRNTTVGDGYMEQISKMAVTRPGLPYTMRNGLVLYKNRVIIPLRSQIPDQLLCEFHDSLLDGHSGLLRTHKRIAQQFYWPSIYRKVHEYVSSCDVCQ